MKKEDVVKKIVWVEKMLIFDIVFLLFRDLINNNTVCYDEHQVSSLCKWFLNLLKKLKIGEKFRPANLTFNSQRGNLPHEIRDRIDFFTEIFLEKYFLDSPVWIRQMVKSYLSNCLLSRINFISMVEIKIVKMKDVKHELFLYRHPINSTIINSSKYSRFKIRQSLLPKEYLKIILTCIHYTVMALLSKLNYKKALNNIDVLKPAIWIEYNNLLFITKNRFLLFWYDFVNTKAFDVVCYFDRVDTPVTKEMTSSIEQKGINWIDCNNLFRLAKLTNNDVIEIGKNLIRINYKLPIWFHFFYLQFNILFKIYYSIYSCFKVKILIQHQEVSWFQVPQFKAIEAAGGIMMGFHWSFYQLPNFHTHLHPQHIYFVWGKSMYETLHKKGNTCRYILPSGLWMTLKDDIQDQVRSLFSKLNFIITVFDSSVAYDNHQTPLTMSKFYLIILKLLEENQTWGAIIKRKKQDNLEDICSLPYGEEIVRRFKLFTEENKVIFLEHTTSPITAAFYSDLTVCYGLNSAGIIAGVHGFQTVHWDCSGFSMHPFYKDKNQKFVYRTLGELEQAVLKFSKGDRLIGDFSAWRKAFNYYDDFDAPKRVGKFIQDFMDTVIKTDDANHSLEYAVKRYTEENKIGDDFFELGASIDNKKRIF